MATTKTLTPTNETITIDAFQGEKPDHRHVADAEAKLADAVNALNSNITPITTLSDTGITSATGAINLTSLFNIYSGTRSIIGLYAESASYPNGIIGQPVKIGSSWFGIFTDTTGAILANKSITVYATVAVKGFG